MFTRVIVWPQKKKSCLDLVLILEQAARQYLHHIRYY